MVMLFSARYKDAWSNTFVKRMQLQEITGIKKSRHKRLCFIIAQKLM
jgi:hypothetical protein